MRWLLGALALLVSVGLAVSAWLLATEPGLQWLAARAQAMTDGKLSIENLRGALTREIHMSSLRYADEESEVGLRGTVLQLELPALLGGRLSVRSIRIDSLFVRLGDPGADPPEPVVLPLSLHVDRADVSSLAIERAGEAYRASDVQLRDVVVRQSMSGVGQADIAELSISLGGDAVLARKIGLHDLQVGQSSARIDRIDIAGLNVQHAGATYVGEGIELRDAILRESGALSAFLSGALRHEAYPATVALRLDGTLERLGVSLEGKVAGVPVRGKATVAPAAEQPLQAVTATIGPADLNRLDAAWPRTALTASLSGKAGQAGALTGALSVRNARPGPLDKDALPVAALEADFATDYSSLHLSKLRVDLSSGGNLTGSGDIRPGHASFDVKVAALDLSALRSTLRPTALAGRLKIAQDDDAQVVQGTITEAGLSITADVRRTGDLVEIRSLRAATEGGEATGTGRVRIGEPTSFEARLKLVRFDPARFGQYPSGDINGSVDAAGTWGPDLRGHARWRIEDSTLDGEAFASRGEGRIDGDRIARADAEARLGSARISARGDFGRAGDELAWQLEAPHIDQFVDGVTGSLRASGRLSGTWSAPQGSAAAQADHVRLPNGMPLHRVSVKASGTLERHAADLSLEADDLDLEARLQGGWQGKAGWAGVIRGLRNTGPYPMELSTPAPLRAAPGRVELGRLEAALGDGRLLVKALTWVNGELASSGEFAGLPAQWLVLAAGLTDELGSSLLLDGQWSIAARPTLTGTLSLRRVAGDITVLGDTPLELGLQQAAVNASFKDGQLAASADVAFAEGRVLVKNLTWENGEFASSGEFTGLPAQWALLAGGVAERVRSTLLVDGQWSLAAAPRLTGTLRLSRAAGDLTVLGDAPLELGLEQVSVEARFKDSHATATADVASRHGSIVLKGTLTPEKGAAGLGITPRSQLALEARVAFAQLRVLTEPLITDARLDGRVSADLRVTGTLEQPKLDGSVNGEELSFDVPPYGVFLKGGVLRAVLDGDVLRITEFSIQGGEGRFVATGTLPLHAADSGPRLSWRAERFGVLERPDMRLVVSGTGEADVTDGRVGLSGALRADRGYLELEQERLPRLGHDVVIVGEPRTPAETRTLLPLALDLQLDLGDALQVRGYGLEGRLAGRLQVETSKEGELRVYGRIQTVNATFMAYGHRLQVDPGLAIFDGPLDNPALQMTAWRRNLPVEAGVQITGTAAAPRVQLVSQPPVPEGERLSWLVLGRAPGEATKADLGLLQAAAGALLARGDQMPLDRRIAQAFGLDEIALRGTGEIADRVVAVGKRLSDRLYVSYEHGLGITATTLVKLDYALTQRLAVRAETGTTSGIGLFYRFSWD